MAYYHFAIDFDIPNIKHQEIEKNLKDKDTFFALAYLMQHYSDEVLYAVYMSHETEVSPETKKQLAEILQDKNVTDEELTEFFKKFSK